MIIVATLILTLPVYWLWNECLVGAIDGVRQIGFFQAMGITMLCSALFKDNS